MRPARETWADSSCGRHARAAPAPAAPAAPLLARAVLELGIRHGRRARSRSPGRKGPPARRSGRPPARSARSGRAGPWPRRGTGSRRPAPASPGVLRGHGVDHLGVELRRHAREGQLHLHHHGLAQGESLAGPYESAALNDVLPVLLAECGRIVEVQLQAAAHRAWIHLAPPGGGADSASPRTSAGRSRAWNPRLRARCRRGRAPADPAAERGRGRRAPPSGGLSAPGRRPGTRRRGAARGSPRRCRAPGATAPRGAPAPRRAPAASTTPSSDQATAARPRPRRPTAWWCQEATSRRSAP